MDFYKQIGGFKTMKEINANEIFNELEKRLENLTKITTEEIFARYGEPAKLRIIGFREIFSKNRGTLIGVVFESEPDLLYFAGMQLQNLYSILLEKFENLDECNKYLSQNPFPITMKYGKSYLNTKMVIISRD